MAQSFSSRHIGPNDTEQQAMLHELGFDSMQSFIKSVIPDEILIDEPLDLPEALTETEALSELKTLARKNKKIRSYSGLGYYDTIVPSPIKRSLFENPNWYTQYTPYQAEISQGRLLSLLNFQTAVRDFTGLPVANASLLDEGTAAAEAMAMFFSMRKDKSRNVFVVDEQAYPQSIAVLKTRAKGFGIELKTTDLAKLTDIDLDHSFGVFVQYPNAQGEIYSKLEHHISRWQDKGTKVLMAADILALALIKSPGELGADAAVGSTQRFGVPLGFGGPHAAYLATSEEFTRKIPGRMVGVSKDSRGQAAVRLSLQTREQHIRREKATSNICTAQALLANMAAMYCVYHGADGIRAIARQVFEKAHQLAGAVSSRFELTTDQFFDTFGFKVPLSQSENILEELEKRGIHLQVKKQTDEIWFGISIDEATTETQLKELAEVFGVELAKNPSLNDLPEAYKRTTQYLEHENFQNYQSETKLMRYMQRLAEMDISLTRSMIPLGSCTMKLNAASELAPVSWEEFSSVHPFVNPSTQAGYLEMISELEEMLSKALGFSKVSMQPNSGAQGEYAGLLAIKAYLESNGSSVLRNVCLIPQSAHGTNPASAAMVGFRVVQIKCDEKGNIDKADLKLKVDKYSNELAALMVTYPSTHGIFEPGIKDICELIHAAGGQVYLDGANMNAQLGLCIPASWGVDVCHLNLDKTFCIPHGGGGPGVGPICVREHLAEFLPSHPNASEHLSGSDICVASAPWGSASILPISWMYLKMMGPKGLKKASETAILNANYMAKKLSSSYDILYKGEKGLVGHECIIDLRNIQKTTGITVEDVAKRLMDYGFHAPTMAWPVAGTLMIEPTESEAKDELDRYCEALISIRQEISEVEDAKFDRDHNVVKNAPHTADMCCGDDWKFAYTREKAAYPAPWLKDYKYWPPVGRVDNAYGDRNFFCTCDGWGELDS